MKILVVDDHVLIREAVTSVLADLERDAIVLEAPDSRRALHCIEENPDIELVVLDLNLPDRSGFDILADLQESRPTISVAVLSVSQGSEDIIRALDLGAVGFIPKSAERDVMLGAFRLIFAGGIYVPPEVFARSRPPVPRAATGRPPAAVTLGLTERQVEVLALMMQGKSNKAICRVLDLAEPTVKNHVTAILKALRVSNRTEAVIAAGRLGFRIDSDSD